MLEQSRVSPSKDDRPRRPSRRVGGELLAAFAVAAVLALWVGHPVYGGTQPLANAILALDVAVGLLGLSLLMLAFQYRLWATAVVALAGVAIGSLGVVTVSGARSEFSRQIAQVKACEWFRKELEDAVTLYRTVEPKAQVTGGPTLVQTLMNAGFMRRNVAEHVVPISVGKLVSLWFNVRFRGAKVEDVDASTSFVWEGNHVTCSVHSLPR